MITVRQAICTYMDKNKYLNDTYVAMSATLHLLCICTQRDTSCGSKQHFHIVNPQFLTRAINHAGKTEAEIHIWSCILLITRLALHFYSLVGISLLYHSLRMDGEGKGSHSCFPPTCLVPVTVI